MLMGLGLRLRVFLIFAGMLGVIWALLGLGLWAAARILAKAGIDFLATQGPGLIDALSVAAIIAGGGALAVVSGIWYLFDQHVARPIQSLAGGLLTGAMPDKDEGHYLADLAPAAQKAAARWARSRADLAQMIEDHQQSQAREKAILESILSDIGAAAIVADNKGVILFYNSAAKELLPGLALDRPLTRFISAGGLDAARARIDAGAEASDIAVISDQKEQLTGRMRRLAEQDDGILLILRPAHTPETPPFAAIENLRRHSAALMLMLSELGGAITLDIARAIRDEARGLNTALQHLDTALAPAQSANHSVAADELALGLPLCLGQVDEVILAADGWQIGMLISHLAARLKERDLRPVLSIKADDQEAVVALEWVGDPISIATLDQWLDMAPDPDQPLLSGVDILVAHSTGIWPEKTQTGACLVMPLARSSLRTKSSPGLTYDFALAGRAEPGARALDGLTYVVFDTETTGLGMDDAIVQIAGMRIAGGRLTGERFETLVNPGRKIPPGSTKIHGITDEMVIHAPRIQAVLRAFHHFCEGAVLVAHNAPFDMGLLHAAEPVTGQHFDNKVLDTVLLSAMVWGQGVPHTLDAICARLEIVIPPELRHTAMGDTEATAKAFLRLLPALADKGIVNFDDVVIEAQKHRRLLEDANIQSRDLH